MSESEAEGLAVYGQFIVARLQYPYLSAITHINGLYVKKIGTGGNRNGKGREGERRELKF